ncbi:MAG: diguanylate cyclase, partial [Pseudomonadota bacterium]|nr:diguanylate cyclase [Pseudomonadota bacterium]
MEMLFLHVLADGLMALVCYAVAALLVFRMYGPAGQAYRPVVLLAGVLMFAAATAHALSVWAVWVADHGFLGLVKAILAVLALSTAAVLWRRMPRLPVPPHTSQVQDTSVVRPSGDERYRVLATLEECRRCFRGIFNHAATGMALISPEGNWLEVNHSLCELLGYPAEELLQTDPRSLTHPDDREMDCHLLQEMLTGTRQRCQIEKRYLHRDGHAIWTLSSLCLVRNRKDEPLYFIAQIQDISERKTHEVLLDYQAHYDNLTGLPNRQLLQDRLSHAIAHARRTGHQVGVLFMDLDRFKRINDTLGHGAGDVLLQRVAARLKAAVREDDTVARLGGDEFVIVLESL